MLIRMLRPTAEGSPPNRVRHAAKFDHRHHVRADAIVLAIEPTAEIGPQARGQAGSLRSRIESPRRAHRRRYPSVRFPRTSPRLRRRCPSPRPFRDKRGTTWRMALRRRRKPGRRARGDGVAKWQRLEERCIDDVEHDGVKADTDRQHGNGGRREQRRAHWSPRRVTQIEDERIDISASTPGVSSLAR